MNGNRTLALVTLLLYIVSLSGCDNRANNDHSDAERPNRFTQTESSAIQILRRGNGSDPETLDPHRAEDQHAFAILRDLFEGLTSESADGALVPGVARRWEISDDGREYTFYLRKDARWSNGDPVLAEDFVAGLRRTLTPGTGSSYAALLFAIRNAEAVVSGKRPPEDLGVEAVDSRTLKIFLHSPTPYFLGVLALAATYPIHAATVRDGSHGYMRSRQYLSNGAYVLSEWRPLAHIRLLRNKHYWNAESVAIDEVVYKPIADTAAELRQYRADELDITEAVPANQFTQVSESLAAELLVSPALALYYFAFDLSESPFDDAAIRQALAMAIDRPTLVDSVTGRGEVAAYGLVPPGVANYAAQEFAWKSLDDAERIAKARVLYAAAGYSQAQPLKFTLTYDSDAIHEKIALAVAAMWRENLGAEVSLQGKEWKLFLATREQRQDWQIMRFAWYGDYNDASTFTDILRSGNEQNLPGYNNPEFDALLQAAAVAPDASQRRELLERAERLMLDDYPIIPAYFFVNKHLVKPYVRNFVPNILDHHYTQHLSLEAPANAR